MNNRHFPVWPSSVPKHLTLPHTSVYQNLVVTAQRYPDKAAIHYYGATLTYAELADQVDRLAGYLMKDLAVGKGDRVLLYMQNSPQYIIAYYAILGANAVVVPVNPMNHTEEVRHIALDTVSRVVISGQECWPRVEALIKSTCITHAIVAAYRDGLEVARDIPLPEVVAAERLPLDNPAATTWQQAINSGRAPGLHTAGPEDYCVLPYSSGTTGAPKGCLHTHGSAMASLVGPVIWAATEPASIFLVSFPLFHVTGMQNSMNGPIFLGATMVIMTRWDRGAAAELIQRYRVTHWRSITTMAVDFLSDPAIDSVDLSSLTMIGGGGAQMPRSVAQRLQALTGLEYIEGYGLSETIGASHINPPDRPKPQCLGIPLFDVDSRIINPESMAECGPHCVGEIIISGPQIFHSYWNRPDATRKAVIDINGKRFLRTGDLGYFDEEGYFFLVDRLKRMINVAGFKVWPAEVEALMLDHPEVREVCIIAARDPRRGETVKAVIVPCENVTELDQQMFKSWCRKRMAAYKVPKIVAIANSLPRSATGKILWRELQEQELNAQG